MEYSSDNLQRARFKANEKRMKPVKVICGVAGIMILGGSISTLFQDSLQFQMQAMTCFYLLYIISILIQCRLFGSLLMMTEFSVYLLENFVLRVFGSFMESHTARGIFYIM